MINTCYSCGKTFAATRARFRYCSPACTSEGRIKNHRVHSERPCAQCGISYYPTHPERGSRFCSNACKSLGQRNRAIVQCRHCRKDFEVNAYRKEKAHYCSQGCRALHLSVGRYIGVRAIKRVTKPTPYERPYYKKQASRTRKRDQYRCQHCGKHYEKGTWKLDVHHIIPLRLGGSDHLSNLITLCKPCHKREDNRIRLAERLSAQPTLGLEA